MAQMQEVKDEEFKDDQKVDEDVDKKQEIERVYVMDTNKLKQEIDAKD